jgi:hypothetical protein
MIGTAKLKQGDDSIEQAALLTEPGMFSWAGRGPEGATCSDCKRWGENRKDRPGALEQARCGRTIAQCSMEMARAFLGLTPACRYFEQHPNPRRSPKPEEAPAAETAEAVA